MNCLFQRDSLKAVLKEIRGQLDSKDFQIAELQAEMEQNKVLLEQKELVNMCFTLPLLSVLCHWSLHHLCLYNDWTGVLEVLQYIVGDLKQVFLSYPVTKMGIMSIWLLAETHWSTFCTWISVLDRKTRCQLKKKKEYFINETLPQWKKQNDQCKHGYISDWCVCVYMHACVHALIKQEEIKEHSVVLIPRILLTKCSCDVFSHFTIHGMFYCRRHYRLCP